MYTLSEKQFELEAKPTLNKIFVKEDPYNQPFSPDVEEKTLLYPVSTSLKRSNPELFDAIISTATELGDAGLYLSLIQRHGPEKDIPYHWYYSFTEEDLATYNSSKYAFTFEQILYSQNGLWGMMISFEDHALLGGTNKFFSKMQEIIPEFDSKKYVVEFLEYWKYCKLEFRPKYNPNINWIPRLLNQIYGSDVTNQLLTETKLSVLIDDE